MSHHTVQALETFVFFFQAEDGIRDHCVTGVQTCALPISDSTNHPWPHRTPPTRPSPTTQHIPSRSSPSRPDYPARRKDAHVPKPGDNSEIGRASCRERV